MLAQCPDVLNLLPETAWEELEQLYDISEVELAPLVKAWRPIWVLMSVASDGERLGVPPPEVKKACAVATVFLEFVYGLIDGQLLVHWWGEMPAE